MSARYIRATISDCWGALVTEDGTVVELGVPTGLDIRGHDFYFLWTLPKRHWHHLSRPTLLRTKIGAREVTTRCPEQVFGDWTETMTVDQQIELTHLGYDPR